MATDPNLELETLYRLTQTELQQLGDIFRLGKMQLKLSEIAHLLHYLYGMDQRSIKLSKPAQAVIIEAVKAVYKYKLEQFVTSKLIMLLKQEIETAELLGRKLTKAVLINGIQEVMDYNSSGGLWWDETEGRIYLVFYTDSDLSGDCGVQTKPSRHIMYRPIPNKIKRLLDKLPG